MGKVHTPPQKVSRVVKARIKPEVEIGGREGGIEIEIGRRGKFLMLGAKSSPPLLGSRTADLLYCRRLLEVHIGGYIKQVKNKLVCKHRNKQFH